MLFYSLDGDEFSLQFPSIITKPEHFDFKQYLI